MPDESSKPESRILTPQTAQAGLAAILAALANILCPGKAAQAIGVIAPLASLGIIWFANRWLKNDEADREAEKETRPLKKVLAEMEERIRVLDANAPERKQLQKQAAGIRETIYQIIIRGAEVTPPPSLPPPPTTP